jgi:hypothetical protein
MWVALTLQFLIFLSIEPSLRVLTSTSFYATYGTHTLPIAIRLLAPAGLVGVSIFGLWRAQQWGWVLAVLVDGAMCSQVLLTLSKLGNPLLRESTLLDPSTWGFAALVVLLHRPVRAHFFDLKSLLGRAILWPHVPAGVSHLARLTYSHSILRVSQLSPREKKLVATFCLAGFLSAWTYSSYHAWVASLYKANGERRMQMENRLSPGYDPGRAFPVWYAENIRLTPYADRQSWIVTLGFPAAMSLALLIAIMAGWLPRVPISLVFATLLSICPALFLMIYLSAVSFFLLLLPSLALPAFLLRLSVEMITRRRPRKFIRTLLIFSAVWSILYVLLTGLFGNNLSEAIWIIPMQMFWAGLYGKALTDSDTFAAQSKVPVSFNITGSR